MKRAILSHKLLVAFVAAAALAGLIDLFAGVGVSVLVVFAALLYAAIRAASGPMSRFIARIRIGIQWKIVAAIGLMVALFFTVSLINLGAMDYMHTELHQILDLQQTNPAGVPAAVAELESTQHGPFFSFAPLIALLGGVIALALGVAIALSIINPIRRMGQAMRRIAEGEFAEPVIVDNRDELGELADRINYTARELARLQEATLAGERARALRERIVQVTAAQEDERRRISRELHDGLGPSLATIVNRLRDIQQVVATDAARAERELDDITQTLKGHIGDIRHLIHDLRPLPLDQLGLPGAIEQLLERFRSEAGVQLAAQVAADVRLDPLAEVTVYRVLQEGLSNVQRHAEASQVEVSLMLVPGGAALMVRDDGQGFPAPRSLTGANGAGVGLVSMHERAELVNGRLSVESAPGAGCTLRLFVPGEPAEATRSEALLGAH